MKMKLNPPLSTYFLLSLTSLTSLTLHAAVPLRWTVETSRVQPAVFDVVRGETIELEAAFTSYGKPVATTNQTAFLCWQTNGMESAWWVTNATTSAANRARAVFTPEMDPGAATLTGFIGLSATNQLPTTNYQLPSLSYRAAFTLRFRRGPGARVNALPLPAKVIDCATVTWLNPTNAPWATGGGGGECRVNDVKTNGVSAVVGKVANLDLAGVEARAVAKAKADAAGKYATLEDTYDRDETEYLFLKKDPATSGYGPHGNITWTDPGIEVGALRFSVLSCNAAGLLLNCSAPQLGIIVTNGDVSVSISDGEGGYIDHLLSEKIGLNGTYNVGDNFRIGDDDGGISNSEGWYFSGTASMAEWANSVDWEGINSTPSTLLGYGITDAYTKSQTANLINGAISHTNAHFSNEVLAVGLNIDTNAVAVLNEIASDFGGFPIQGTATTVGGLLAALAAAVAWLKKNKVGSFASVGGVTPTVSGGVADVSSLFSGDNASLMGVARYSNGGASSATMADRTTNVYTLNAPDATVTLVFPDPVENKMRDFLLDLTYTAGTLQLPSGVTKVGDELTFTAGKEYLIAFTEISANRFYVRSIEIA